VLICSIVVSPMVVLFFFIFMEELFLNIDTGKQIIFINVSENYTISFLDLDVCYCMCVF
jgi:hypothetical protein